VHSAEPEYADETMVEANALADATVSYCKFPALRSAATPNLSIDRPLITVLRVPIRATLGARLEGWACRAVFLGAVGRDEVRCDPRT
jgi:hypothetical protein